MADNPDLDEYVVHNVNATPQLPFEADTFDAVVLTVSIQYITQPIAVFQEVGRILRPVVHLWSSSRTACSRPKQWPSGACSMTKSIDLIAAYFQHAGNFAEDCGAQLVAVSGYRPRIRSPGTQIQRLVQPQVTLEVASGRWSAEVYCSLQFVCGITGDWRQPAFAHALKKVPMQFIADLHIHSRYARATSRELNLENLHKWARSRALPSWARGFHAPVLVRRAAGETGAGRGGSLPTQKPMAAGRRARTATHLPGRGALSALGEISSIYKKNGRTRKVQISSCFPIGCKCSIAALGPSVISRQTVGPSGAR